MADVPFATNLLSAIDPLIANAPGAMLPGQAIGNLPDAYWAGLNQQYLQRNRNLFQNGVPTNIQDLATMLLRSRGAEGVPEAVSLGNLGVIQGIANRPTQPFNPEIGTYTTPGPQTGAQPQTEPSPSPTAGMATPRQMAQARASEGITLDQIMAASGATNPDQQLNFEQRQAAINKLREGQAGEQPQAFADRFPPIKTSGNVSVAGTPTGGGTLPPSIGAPSPPAPRPQAQPAQVAQAQPQAQAPQGPADPMAQQLEMRAALLQYRAQVARQSAVAAGGAGGAGKVVAEQLNGQAAAWEQEARDIHKNLLERSMPTTEARNVLNPAIRSSAALTGVDKIDAEAYAKDYGSLSNLARSANTQGLSRVEELKTLTTDPNFYSGPFSKGMQSYRQFQSYFGRDPAAATPMEAFNKGVKDILTESIKGLAASGVGRVNLAEVRNMQGATATLENTPAGNRAQLEVLRRTYLQQQAIGQIAEGVNQEIASGRIPPGQFRARLNQAVDTYAQRNKMFTPMEQQNPILLGAVDAPADFTRQPLAQARAWGLQRNVHSGDPLHMPDGSYIKAP